mgnify:CR=1 FL=1
MHRCETWCGNTSKPRAKTIDLCNNPLTKEPKLSQATRVIGERWSALDAVATGSAQAVVVGLQTEATTRIASAQTLAHADLGGAFSR